MPTATRRSARSTAPAASYRESTVSDEELPAPPAGTKRKRTAARAGSDSDTDFAREQTADASDASALTPLEDEEDEYDFAKLNPPPKKKAPARKKARTAEDGADDVAETPAKQSSPTKRALKMKADADAEGGSPSKPPRKARKPREPKPEPVYVIPDVEKQTTAFRGRLGYACLNTILRNKKPADQAVFCSRTCRIDSIKKNGLDFVKELGRQNIKDLMQLIEWNEANNIRFMRMSSEMFPFASHPEYGYTLEYCAAELAAAGALAQKYGHRLTTHPGQFTQLGSPRPQVVTSAVRDLTYHCEMIDRMGLGKDSVMIIHGGGTYNDKPAALERIKKSYTELLPQNVKDRLVLENDEMCYSAEDLLPLCEELGIPLVFDYHHDWILPSSIPRAEIIARAHALFTAKGIRPKQHLSEPRPGAVTVMERRAHADRCQRLPDELPDDMDLMIEAKDKEQAVLHLYRIYDLHPVIQASLRPPAEHETKETKGRKSSKAATARAATAKAVGRKKAARTGVVPDEEEVKGEDPVVPVDEDGAEDGAPRSSRTPGKMQVAGLAELEGELEEGVKKASRKTPRKTSTKVAKKRKGGEEASDEKDGLMQVDGDGVESALPVTKARKSAKASRTTKGKARIIADA